MNDIAKTSRNKSLSGMWAKWRRRSRTERRLFLEAFLFLGMARLGGLILPFRFIAKSLGRSIEGDETPLSPSELKRARMIGGAVRTAAQYAFWRSACLQQAIAAKWMLKRRLIPGTLHLGVMKDESKPEELAAHAWVRCGPVILTGAHDLNRYTVVARFS